MELRQLRYFVTVAEEMHFGRAAERLHIVQPAVSQQIRRLEREIGVSLFDRSPRRVQLTAEGRRLLPEARAVLAAADRARAVLADRHTTTLRLGTSTGLGEHLDRVLDTFARLAPDVRVELASATTQARLDQVRAGQLDATFVRGINTSPELEMHPVWDDSLVVALPARNPIADAETIDLVDLAELPLRLPDRRANPPLFDLVTSTLRDCGVRPVLVESGTLQDTLSVVGVGERSWTVLYEAHARLLALPRVAVRRPRPPLAITTYLAVSRTSPPACLPALLRACTTDGSGDHDR